MARQAIAVWPNGQVVNCQPEGFASLRNRFRDYIANGDQPQGTRFFRVPRRIEVHAGLTSRFDRVCPKCRCGIRYHDKPCV